MEKIKFKTLLFDIACSSMACDGHIDDREIKELKEIDKTTPYFRDVDLSKRLNRFVESYKDDSEKTIETVIDQLNDSSLNLVEEMLVLEIALRIVYSDTKIDPKEVDYLKSIRSGISIDNKMLLERFGVIDFLLDEKEIIDSTKAPEEKTIDSADLTNLENLYFIPDDKKESK